MRTWIRSFLDALPVHFFEWLALDGQKCLSFGGVSGYGYDDSGKAGVIIRICNKNRWHTDSHAYDPEVYMTHMREGTL